MSSDQEIFAVKKLAELTGCSFKVCKKILRSCEWDIVKARTKLSNKIPLSGGLKK